MSREISPVCGVKFSPLYQNNFAKKGVCVFKYYYDDDRISMEDFINAMEMNKAHNDFIEWENNVLNFPGITDHSWCWGFYKATYSENLCRNRK